MRQQLDAAHYTVDQLSLAAPPPKTNFTLVHLRGKLERLDRAILSWYGRRPCPGKLLRNFPAVLLRMPASETLYTHLLRPAQSVLLRHPRRRHCHLAGHLLSLMMAPVVPCPTSKSVAILFLSRAPPLPVLIRLFSPSALAGIQPAATLQHCPLVTCR